MTRLYLLIQVDILSDCKMAILKQFQRKEKGKGGRNGEKDGETCRLFANTFSKVGATM